MPKTFSYLVDQGVSFENMFTLRLHVLLTRVTYLRGQYSHNHKVLTNDYPTLAT